MTAPVEVVFKREEVTPDMASAVVVAAVPVALPKTKLPVRVVEASWAEERASNPPLALSTPPMLSIPVMVVEACTAKLPVVVPERREKSSPVKRPVLVTLKSVVVESPTVEEAMAKRVRLVEEAPWSTVKVA